MCDQSQLPSPWDVINIQFRNPTLLTRLLKCQGINEVIDSQASLSQLLDGGANIIGLALHPPETAMMREPGYKANRKGDQGNQRGQGE